MPAASHLLPLPAALAMLLAGAHFWRAGYPALSAACGLLALLSWARAAWVRQILLLVLPLLAARWIWSAGQFVQMRQFMEQPWHRLAAILLGVALFTALAALPLLHGRARRRYARNADTAAAQTAALALTIALLGAAYAAAPGMFLAERFLPGWGLAQVCAAGLWAAWVAGRLGDRRAAPHIRLRVWRLFSLLFFSQLALGLVLDSRFLLSGDLHLPVPGVMLAAPLYRGGGYFMLILFAVSVLLVGAAWCSQLCYFGVWDASAAARASAPPRRPPPAWLRRLRLCVLGLTLLVPTGLRLSGAPLEAALACGLLPGLPLLPCAALISRRLGYGAYCAGICPLGLVASWLGKLAPWRIRRTGSCDNCQACVRACRYGAMNKKTSPNRAPGASCTLCRDCLAACPRQALSLCCYSAKCSGPWAEAAFIVLLASLHAVFLAMARV